MMATSAGLLLFRFAGDGLEVLIAHPGGPLWAKRNVGAWTIPKGLVDEGEDALETARREFLEETGFDPEGPFLDLGDIVQKAGKRVVAWAAEGDLDPHDVESNTFQLEWPPRSGIIREYPEIDRVAWVRPDEAVRLLNPAQSELIDRLLQALTEQ